MCHGLISEQRAAVSVPDLLRSQIYELEPGYDKGDFQENGIFSMIDESVLMQETSSLQSEGLSAGDLADLVEDYSSAVKKFEGCEDVDTIPAGTWLDCIKDAVTFDSVAPLVEPKLSPHENAPLEPKLSTHEDAPLEPKLSPHDDTPEATQEVSKAPKSRKARKSAAVKGQSHAQYDSEMDDDAPVLIDEKRKRRMSSNRASAQRSRQRKQERLDELEILTAQLRLENATLARKSKVAEQLAKRIEAEKNELAKQVEELRKELEATRQPRTRGSLASGDDLSETCGNLNSGVCDMVETSPKELQMPSKSTTSVKRVISSTDLSSGLFQELYDAFESDQFDVTLGGSVSDLLQEEWYGSFTDCLNA